MRRATGCQGQARGDCRGDVHGQRQGGQWRRVDLPRARRHLAGDLSGAWRRPSAPSSWAHACEETLRRRDDVLADALATAAATTPAGSTLSRATTVGEFAGWWLRNVAANRVRVLLFGKYEDRVERITPRLGGIELGALRAEQVATWQTELLGTLSAQTVTATRSTLRSIIEEAVNLELIATNPVSRVRPPRAARPQRRALTAEQGRALVSAAASERLGAAVVLLFVQGWRVSEVLGLARGDLDLDAGGGRGSPSVLVRRQDRHGARATEDGRRVLGRHHLTPVVVELLRRRRQAQLQDRLRVGQAWERHTYDGHAIDLVFTTATGGLLRARPLPRQSALLRTGRASTQQASGPTPVVRRRSPRRTPRKASTSRTSPGTSDMPIRRRRPATSATSATARSPPLKPPAACSIRRWTSSAHTGRPSCSAEERGGDPAR